MFCTKCGAQLPENSEFCNVCGTKQAPLMPMQPEMPVQPMVQGVQSMYNSAMQNPMNGVPNPQGYQMNPNMGNNAKKKINPVVWIVLAVVLIAIAVVAVILLKKENDKREAEHDAAVNQWNQTVQDAQNAAGNNGYTDNNDYSYDYDYSNTSGCISWEEAVFDYVQCYWDEDLEGALATTLEPQRELIRDGIRANYGSEEAFWEAVYAPWFEVCGDHLSMDFEIVDATRLEGAEQLASVENTIYNECGYRYTLTDAYLLQIDIEYSGDIGTASDAWYFYAVQVDGSWYLYEL